MLCYMKKCPTIYIKIGTVLIATRAAFGFKSILQNKEKCHHKAALLALIHTHKNAFQLKKKLQNRLHMQKKHPTIKESNLFYFSVAHILLLFDISIVYSSFESRQAD